MKVKAFVFVCSVLLAFKILAADGCNTNLYSKKVITKYSEGFPVTNVTKVGWQILSTLEGAIDVRCVLFLFSLRQCPQSSVDEEFCRKKLKEACLYGKLFSVETKNAFRVVRVLKEDVYDQIELTKAISATVTLSEERARKEFFEMEKMWTSPPVATNRKNIDIKFWMTGKEQYENIVLYAYFKTIFLKTMFRYLEEDVKIDERGLARFSLTTFDFREEDDVPSDDEVDFVLNVVTNQTTIK